jgi:hypothetical protein
LRITRVLAATAALAAVTIGTSVSAGPAHAYGGDGKMDVYQVGVSFNCDNPSFCGSENLGGFWGWGEFDHNPQTGVNTGDAQLTGCGHSGQFSGASHTSVEVTDWWIAPGSAGPNTFFTNEIDTMTFRGHKQVVTTTNNDTGVPAVPGHYSTSQIFGFTPPPGVSAQIQVAFKPAH